MASGFYKYAQLVKQTTSYATKMNRLSAKIFGEVSRPASLKSMKVVALLSQKPVEQEPEFNHYYPRHNEIHVLMKMLRYHGLYRDEHEDFKEEMKRLRKLRGKGPPKKGEGKRKQQQQ